MPSASGARRGRLYVSPTTDDHKLWTVDHAMSDPLDKCRVYRHMFFAAFGFIVYSLDVASDLYVAYTHYTSGDVWWCVLTCTFVALGLLGTFIASVYFSLRIVKDQDDARACAVFRLLLHALLVAPVLWYVETIYHGIVFCVKRSQRHELREKRAKRALKSTEFSTFLSLIESSLESAPQLILQLYILAKRAQLEVNVALVSCIFSLLSVAWSLTSYERAERHAQGNNNWASTFIVFLWRIMIVCSRIVAFATFAYSFQEWLFLALGLHLFAMFLFLYCVANMQREHPVKTFLMNCLFAIFYVFSFIKVKTGPTLKHYVCYYIVIIIENGLFLSLPYLLEKDLVSVYFEAVAVGVGTFVLGILLQILYYWKFHPNKFSCACGTSEGCCCPCCICTFYTNVGTHV